MFNKIGAAYALKAGPGPSGDPHEGGKLRILSLGKLNRVRELRVVREGNSLGEVKSL